VVFVSRTNVVFAHLSSCLLTAYAFISKYLKRQLIGQLLAERIDSIFSSIYRAVVDSFAEKNWPFTFHSSWQFSFERLWQLKVALGFSWCSLATIYWVEPQGCSALWSPRHSARTLTRTEIHHLGAVEHNTRCSQCSKCHGIPSTSLDWAGLDNSPPEPKKPATFLVTQECPLCLRSIFSPGCKSFQCTCQSWWEWGWWEWG